MCVIALFSVQLPLHPLSLHSGLIKSTGFWPMLSLSPYLSLPLSLSLSVLASTPLPTAVANNVFSVSFKASARLWEAAMPAFRDWG